ncbi:hypothetical protein L3081_18755 [Colwellia sp. MSW7]|uniref:Cytochrome-c peroxidase n=1 Tax=Colwellia maritima TaxID=2912588 RepID=A0ABS9X7P5_9GAMM|nr:hypothetical protein [Colwellia maritima]MCI2285062.1 hypothetical protein [Colwellia maritima]
MHSGAYENLTDSVKHSVNAKQSIEQFNNIVISQPGMQNLDMVVEYAQKAIASDNFEGSEPDLTEQDIEDLVSFLNALTDPCITDRECMMPWILEDGENQDPNGDQVIAIDQHGEVL